MPIEIVCGSCGAKYTVNERFAGKRAKCRKCGMIMQVPGTPVSLTGSSPILDSPMIERPPLASPAPRGSMPDFPQPRPLAPRPTPQPQPVARQAAPGEPLILSSNAAEYGQGAPPTAKHWTSHLSRRTWIVIGAAVVVIAAVGLLLLFDPTLFFPSSLPPGPPLRAQ